MFDRIARRYDLVNTVLSAGTDGGWRRRAARATGLKPGGSALDVACGSGKLTAQLARIAGPRGPIGAAYRVYLKTLLPAIGGALSGEPAAYRYLSDTVDSYRTAEELEALAIAAGWASVRLSGLAAGTVSIVSGGR